MDGKQTEFGTPDHKELIRKRVQGTNETVPAEFYDIHCHAHTLSHPAFLAIIQT